MNDELLYNQLYERTKEFGRTQFVREIMRLERENKELHNKIDKAIKYVSQLSSKGRDCEIYWDIKQEILKILKESDVDECE